MPLACSIAAEQLLAHSEQASGMFCSEASPVTKRVAFSSVIAKKTLGRVYYVQKCISREFLERSSKKYRFYSVFIVLEPVGISHAQIQGNGQ